MHEFALFKQDFLIGRKNLLICGALQFFSLVLAVLIRNMRLMDISDIFWDTLPVVVIPMGMQIALAYQLLWRRERDKTMDFLLTNGIAPNRVILLKAVFMILCTFVLLALSMLFGCLTHVYDLTGVWNRDSYVVLNLGGMCLQLLGGGWCFLICALGRKKTERFYWGLGAGLLILFYVIYLIYYLYPGLFVLRYVTVFSLFEQASYASAGVFTMLKSLALAVLGAAFFWCGGVLFCKNSFRG